MLRSMLVVFLLCCSVQASTVVYVDLQGSVSGGWPSALAGKKISQTVVIKNVTDYQSYDLTWSAIDPNNWPNPNDRGGELEASIGDVIKANSIRYDHDPEILVGSDGKKYAVELAGDVIVTHTIAASEIGGYVTLPMTITLKTHKEDPDNTDPTPQNGDANKDGDVDWFDIKVIEGNFGMTNADWEDGDFDNDNDVDFIDFLAAAVNFVAWP